MSEVTKMVKWSAMSNKNDNKLNKASHKIRKDLEPLYAKTKRWKKIHPNAKTDNISAVSPSAQNVYADICCSILVALLQYLYRYLQQSDTFIYVMAHTAYAVFCAHTVQSTKNAHKNTQTNTDTHSFNSVDSAFVFLLSLTSFSLCKSAYD